MFQKRFSLYVAPGRREADVPVSKEGREKGVMPWRWRIVTLLALVSADVVGARESGGGGGGDLLSGVSGTYTHFHDDDLFFTVAYDLQDDSSVPFSYVTG